MEKKNTPTPALAPEGKEEEHAPALALEGVREGAEPEPEHWTVGRWGTFRQYLCRYCPWDSLDEAEAAAHHVAHHAPIVPPNPIVVADRFGRPKT